MDDDILDKIRENFRIYEVNPSNSNPSHKPSIQIKYEKTTIEANVPAYGIRYHLICLIHEIFRKLGIK